MKENLQLLLPGFGNRSGLIPRAAPIIATAPSRFWKPVRFDSTCSSNYLMHVPKLAALIFHPLSTFPA